MSDIRMERTYYASRELVLDAWRTRELLVEWFSPDASTSAYVEELDFASGGRWRATVGQDIFSGYYTELNLPERFVFTWVLEGEDDESPSTVVVHLTERAENTTELLLQHNGIDDSDEAQRYERDWTAMLDRLDQVVRNYAG